MACFDSKIGENMLKTIYTILDRIRLSVIVVAFIGMVVLCFTQVILRYFVFLNFRPFPWGDEMLRHTAIWLAFLAASVGVREGNHLHL
jgi:TRAP-type C4-dicarboxylate transport system permease small subunit